MVRRNVAPRWPAPFTDAHSRRRIFIPPSSIRVSSPSFFLNRGGNVVELTVRHRCAASARSLTRMSTLEFSKVSPRYCSATCPATHHQISFFSFLLLYQAT